MPPVYVNLKLPEVRHDIGTQSTIAISAMAIDGALALLLPEGTQGQDKLRQLRCVAHLRLNICFGDLLVLKAEFPLRPIPMVTIM